MRWCQEHWDKLRAEVKRQGLDALVPDTGEKAVTAFVRTIEGEESVDSFDPLMGAMWAVNEFIAMPMDPDNTGIGMLAVIGLDGCPVCEVDKWHMQYCTDPRHEKPCTISIDWCFVNAVEDQRKIFEGLA